MTIGINTSRLPLSERSSECLALVSHLLPSAVKDMAASFGLVKALRITEALSGTTLNIPSGSRARTVDALSQKLDSEELATDLVAWGAGIKIYIPSCSSAEGALRDIDIHIEAEEGIASGKSMNHIVNSLAHKYKLSDRRVWIILKKQSFSISNSSTDGVN